MNTENLFWLLYNAKNEDELHSFVLNDSILSDNNNWFPYGGRDKNDRSNFSTFQNQQSKPVPALIEKITNSIDSILLKQCRLDGIEPESKFAPASMAQAVEKFFRIKMVILVKFLSLGEEILQKIFKL